MMHMKAENPAISDAFLQRLIARQKRGAKPVNLDTLLAIVDGAGDPDYRMEQANISRYDLACLVVRMLECRNYWTDQPAPSVAAE